MKTTRRIFLNKISIGTTGFIIGANSFFNEKGYAGNKLTKKEFHLLRDSLKHRKRRVIVNNDGNDKPASPVTAQSFLTSRTIGMEHTQVDTVFYCTGVFNLYSHNSNESEVFNIERKPWCRQLIAQGTDSLEIMTDWCHQNNREIFWSMRMNDTHDSSSSRKDLLCQWKKDHPEYLIGKKGDFFPHGNFRWSSLNYELKPVRDKVFAILHDVCSRYNIDGIELDFFRHPIFFEDTMQGGEANQKQRDLVTSLMQQIRKMTEQEGMRRGHPILVSIRIPDSLGYCNALGLDVKRWLDENLFDIMAVGDYFKLEPWEKIAAVGKKYDIPVYVCLEKRRLVDEPENKSQEHLLKVFRGEAYNALLAGINGIYLFNEFNPMNPMLNELGSIEILSKLDRIDQTAYVQRIWSRPEVWLATASKYFNGTDTPCNPDAIINENLIPYRERQKFFYKRPVIYNNDGNENLTKVQITPQNFLDNRTTGLGNSKISSIFYCTGLTVKFTHKTQIGARFGYNNVGDKRKGFPAELDRYGTDSLSLQIDYARRHHKEIFWSMRMNDTHDSALDDNHIRNTWKEEHPECLMGERGEKFPYASRWSALDYSKAEVRKFIYGIIEEVARNYNVDGIELDFFRHPVYFKEVMLGGTATEKNLQLMTGLIENIRRMTENVSRLRGRPLLVAIHIPDSLDYCKAIGLDVKNWLENDLIDVVVGGGYFQFRQWKDFVEMGKQYHVPVYACFESRRIVPKEKAADDKYLIERFRGAALDAWNAGIDGIYAFNLWYNANSKYKNLFTEMGYPELLKKLDRIDGPSFVADYGFPPERFLKGGRDFVQD
ncbi:MAG: hypothetical protein AB2L24_26530 [Mangrovibacterium sp.]